MLGKLAFPDYSKHTHYYSWSRLVDLMKTHNGSFSLSNIKMIKDSDRQQESLVQLKFDKLNK